MALIKTDMQLAAVGGGNKVFFYNTTDPQATVIGAGYFNTMAAQLTIGDRIHLRAVSSAYDLVVSNISGGVVTVQSSVAYA